MKFSCPKHVKKVDIFVIIKHLLMSKSYLGFTVIDHTVQYPDLSIGHLLRDAVHFNIARLNLMLVSHHRTILNRQRIAGTYDNLIPLLRPFEFLSS